jgi:hypothetical protein
VCVITSILTDILARKTCVGNQLTWQRGNVDLAKCVDLYFKSNDAAVKPL